LQLRRDHRFCIVSGVATRPEAVVELAERIAFVQESNFGRTFEVVSEPDPHLRAVEVCRGASGTTTPRWRTAST
jgi:hypothetical protein